MSQHKERQQAKTPHTTTVTDCITIALFDITGHYADQPNKKPLDQVKRLADILYTFTGETSPDIVLNAVDEDKMPEAYYLLQGYLIEFGHLDVDIGQDLRYVSSEVIAHIVDAVEETDAKVILPGKDEDWVFTRQHGTSALIQLDAAHGHKAHYDVLYEDTAETLTVRVKLSDFVPYQSPTT